MVAKRPERFSPNRLDLIFQSRPISFDEQGIRIVEGERERIGCRTVERGFLVGLRGRTAPFGNDTGADTLSEYWKWRRFHEAMSSIDFLPKLMRGWGVNDRHRDLTDEESVQKALSADGFSVSTYDDAIIALYFGEVIIDGRSDPHVHPYALKAIERQMLPVCIRLYADHAQEERLARLKRMRGVLMSLE